MSPPPPAYRTLPLPYSHVHLLDVWWNPAVEDQAMVRDAS